MSHRKVEYRAVVDWIALRFQLCQRSNFMTVQEVLRNVLYPGGERDPYVKALDETEGRSASHFEFRIQNSSQAKVDQVVHALRKRFEVAYIAIAGIEIAFDTNWQGATVHELAEVAVDRYQYITAIPGTDWYFYRREGEGRHYINDCHFIQDRRSLLKHFAEGWQLADQNSQGAGVRYHLYVKTWDNGRDLLPQFHRARCEITLQGEGLPCKTLDELAGFEFGSLAGYFKFRRLRDDLSPFARKPLMTWSTQQLGRTGNYRRPNKKKIGTYSGTRMFRVSTVADLELNDIVYECLRKLTRDWRSKRVRADFPEDF